MSGLGDAHSAEPAEVRALAVDPRLCGHAFEQSGMTLTATRAYLFRRCAICGFTEYRDQNEPLR